MPGLVPIVIIGAILLLLLAYLSYSLWTQLAHLREKESATQKRANEAKAKTDELGISLHTLHQKHTEQNVSLLSLQQRHSELTAQEAASSQKANELVTALFALREKHIELTAQEATTYKKASELETTVSFFHQRYGRLIDKDAELARLLAQQSQLQQAIAATEHQIQIAQTYLAGLQEKIGALEEQSELQSFGFYQLKYDFEDAAAYEQRLDAAREKQKELIKNEKAAICKTEWTVGGSKKDGAKMTKNNLRLMLRAFNGECDAAVSKVKYNNIEALNKRMEASFEAINKAGEINQCEITRQYLQLKLDELYLVHGYQEKRQDELEIAREEREKIKEEEKAQRELEKAKETTEKEERTFQAAMEKARAEVESSTGKQREKMELRLAELTEQLKALEEKKRAISQAQLTASGYVYIISNVGSFGEGIVKIGMTRRLDPMDRVKELGDASVPFTFDVHAMIFSENAPDMERRLHKLFHEKRVNRINERKEFFRASLKDVEQAVHRIAQEVKAKEFTFHPHAPAEEYRKTIAMLETKVSGIG
jgi:hypothetical protein